MTHLCRACGQEIRRRSARICGLCGLPILRHHKYTYNGSQIEHRVCAAPKEYDVRDVVEEIPAKQQRLGDLAAAIDKFDSEQIGAVKTTLEDFAPDAAKIRAAADATNELANRIEHLNRLFVPKGVA